MPEPPRVVVVGAGMAGTACARVLHDAGVPVRLLDRGRRIGGRMAVRHVEGRPVDVGASYLTTRDDRFTAVVAGWQEAGLARPWTDTFHVAGPGGIEDTTTGAVRWAAPHGLRSLVEALAEGLPVESGHDVEEVGPGPEVDGTAAEAVVLAMPDPQAGDLLSDSLADEVAVVEAVAWEPVLAVAAGWDARRWPDLDGVFVNGCDVLAWVADDGRRRGDGAPVLVAHSTSAFAAQHLDDPSAAGPAMIAQTRRVLGIDAEPRWAQARRWSLARPATGRTGPYHLGPARVGLCGDGWHGPPRVEAAYLSGRLLGEELARQLG